MKRCLYCNQEKDESEFSEEHVLPQAVGGNLSPRNPFKTSDVCGRCNNLCGWFVDAGFIKSYFTQAGRAEEARRRVRFDQNTIFPLTYLGVMPSLEYRGKVCEMWVGPTGDSVYHFHDPYPQTPDMPAMVGPAPNIRSQIDSGFVFVFVVASNPVWHVPILRSVIHQFPGASMYLANGNTPQGGRFSNIPPELVELHESLKGMRGKSHPVRHSMTVDAEVRFLAKLALGLGHLFLHPDFSPSPDAGLLRAMMWAKTPEARESIPVHGTGFFGERSQSLKEYFSWPSGHLLMLYPVGNQLALHASFYGHQVATIQISGNPAHWDGKIPVEGVAYAISPGLRNFAGPIALRSFLGHRQGVLVNDEMAALENAILEIPPLPPTHLQQQNPDEVLM